MLDDALLRSRVAGPLTRLRALVGQFTAAGLLLICGHCPAQDALRNSLVGEWALEARQLSRGTQPYTIKAGDLRLLMSASAELAYNDNIDLQSHGGLDDFIIKPMLRTAANYPLTERNVLFVNIGFGYDQYFQEHQYDQWRLESGSQVAFDIFVKDFWINIHDRFEYYQDSAREASIAGTGAYGMFENTAGLIVTWGLGDLLLTSGYDHQTAISVQDQFAYLDRRSEFFNTRAGLRLRPDLTTGVEGSVGLTSYEQNYLNDSTSYSAGLFGDWEPGKALRIRPRTGYSYYDFAKTSDFLTTGDVEGWYMDVTLTHDVTSAITYAVSGGHQFRLGVESDVLKEWYARTSVTWRAFKNISLNTFASYQNGRQGLENARGNISETYDWFRTGIGATWPFMKRLAVGMHYIASFRASNLPDRDYLQNVVGLSLTYRP